MAEAESLPCKFTTGRFSPLVKCTFCFLCFKFFPSVYKYAQEFSNLKISLIDSLSTCHPSLTTVPSLSFWIIERVADFSCFHSSPSLHTSTHHNEADASQGLGMMTSRKAFAGLDLPPLFLFFAPLAFLLVLCCPLSLFISTFKKKKKSNLIEVKFTYHKMHSH